MIEQWFLDLDGVRSGPYQTPEVLSLVAEGEVLPHHRISIGLKDQPWTTILDWRLEQAKASAQAAIRAKESAPPPKPEPIQVETSIPLSIAEPLPLPPTPVTPSAPVAPTTKAPKQAPLDMPMVETIAAAKAASDLKVKSEVEVKIVSATPASVEQVPPASTPAPAPSSAPPKKRDPAAEMFDMLEKSKQKRNAKAQQAAIEEAPPAKSEEKRIFGMKLSSALGLVITVIGFVLGQVFQQSAPPPPKENVVVQTAPATPPVAEVAPSAPSTHPQGTEVIDRSNDKMTIRSTVERHAEPTPAPKPVMKTAPVAVSGRKNPQGVQSEKELEELQNLRKELQELKALKTNPNMIEDDGMGDSTDGEIDPNAPPLPPAQNYNYNTYPVPNPNAYEQAR